MMTRFLAITAAVYLFQELQIWHKLKSAEHALIDSVHLSVGHFLRKRVSIVKQIVFMEDLNLCITITA